MPSKSIPIQEINLSILIHINSDGEDDPQQPAATSMLPACSTCTDRLTQAKFNLANGTIQRGPTTIVAGIQQPTKHKANTGKPAPPNKSQKKTATSDATSTQKHAPKASVPFSDDNSSSGEDDGGNSNNGHKVDKNEASKYDHLHKEGAHNHAVCATFFILCSRLCLHIQYI
jgi:hypothetical protein